MTLYDAIVQENVAEVKRILEEEPALIQAAQQDGVPLSFRAAGTGNLELVRYIVEYSRASFDEHDRNHRSILHYAAESGSVEVCRYLVERVGMKPGEGDKDLITPYDIAANRQDTKLCTYFEQVCGAKLSDMYRNPIRTGMFPDPSICRVGDDYYMANSSFIFFPCIPISHSRDLIHWEIIGHAITNPEWAHIDELEGGRGYWAPDISYYNGKFYVCATYRLNDTGTVYRKQIIVSSDKPEGPYSEPAVIDEDGIDPSIFNDEDGRRYMLLNRGARILELNAEATKQIGEARLLYYGDHKRAPEGPHLLKKDGYYYLFEAEGGTGPGHRITVSRSRELTGIYEPCPFNPIMRQEDPGAPIQRCGHGKPVMTPAGDWYMVYLCGRQIDGKYSMLGRETAIDPITWTADGWPMVNRLQGPSCIQKKPDLPEVLLQNDDALNLDKTELSPLWITPRAPEKGAIQIKDGALYLKGSKAPLSSVDSRNILVRRQTDFCFTAEAQFQLQPMTEGQCEGLICYYDENSWVHFGAFCEAGTYRIKIAEHIGTEDIVHTGSILEIGMEDENSREKEIGLEDENSGGKETGLKDENSREQEINRAKENERAAGALPVITYKVVTNYLRREFSYRVNQGEWQPVKTLDNVYYLSDEGVKMGKRFTGAMVGVAAYAGQKEYTAKILSFTYYK